MQPNQLSVYVRRWFPSDYSVGPFQEIVLDDNQSIEHLKEKVGLDPLFTPILPYPCGSITLSQGKSPCFFLIIHCLKRSFHFLCTCLPFCPSQVFILISFYQIFHLESITTCFPCLVTSCLCFLTDPWSEWYSSGRCAVCKGQSRNPIPDRGQLNGKWHSLVFS